MSSLQGRGLIAAALIGIYALLGFLLAPWLIERNLVSTLSERADLNTRVGAISLNPFTFRLQLDDLEITEADTAPLIAFEQLLINFELSSLFQWAWSFDEIHLVRPVIHFERFSETSNTFSVLANRWVNTGDPIAIEPEVDVDMEGDSQTTIPRLIITDLQIVSGHLAISDQIPTEHFSTSLTPIDLALSDFSTLPDENGAQRVTISTESGASVAWTGTLSVNPLAVNGKVTLQGTYTPMLFRYFQDQLDLPLSFDGGALEASLNYEVKMDDSGQLSARISSLEGSLTGLNVNQPDQSHLAEVDALRLSGGRFAWPELDVHVDSVRLDRVLLQAYRYPHGGYFPPSDDTPASDQPAQETAPEPEPEPEPEPPESAEGLEAVAEDAASWTISVDSLELGNWRLIHTDLSLTDGAVEIANLDLSASQISNEAGQEIPLALTTTLLAGGTFNLNGRMQILPEFQFTAELTGTDLAVASAQPYLTPVANISIDDGRIGFEGNIASSVDEPFLYSGSFRLEDLSLIDRAQEESLLSWKSLNVDRLSLTPAALELSILTLEAPYARIEIEEDGSTNIERTLQPNQTDTETADNERDDSASPAFALTIGESRVADGTAHFTDLALPLPFEANISKVGGSLSTLATNSREPVRIELDGQVNEFGHLQVRGDLSAFQPSAGTDINVDFENVNVPRMTPYTIKFAGREIADGRMDLGLSYQLNEGELSGTNQLVIRDLKLGEKVEQPGAMDLPLDMAVALLKDPSGNLDFSFPVSGSLDDPEFSYSDAVGKAFSNVVLGLATAPFRLLGSLVGLKAEEVDSIGFEPGQADLTPPQKEMLLKLTEALKQRPQLILEFAPVTNPEADRAAIAVALVDSEVDERLSDIVDDDVLVTEQRRQVLEAIYAETGIQPSFAELKPAHEHPDESGKRTLDIPAYTAELREALINERNVPALDTNLLAQRRLESLRLTLTELASLEEERLRTLPITEVALNDDGLVQMSLNVTTAD